MASNWIKLKRFVARSLKRRERPTESAPLDEVAVSDRRRRHLISQIAGLDEALRRIQGAIDSAADGDGARPAPMLARHVVRARDVRYKKGLLQIELGRGTPGARRRPVPSSGEPGAKVAPREVIETARELLGRGALEAIAPPDLVAEAVGHLLEGSAGERRDSIGFLRALHSEAAIPVLKAALAFDDDWIRVECTGALADFGQARAVSELVELLDAGNPRLRTAALRGLNGIDAKLAHASCLRGLADRDSEVRRTAATFLGWHRSTHAVGALSALLKDEEVAVRIAAAEALGQIDSDKAILPLIRALADGDLEVRRTARQGLKQALAGPVDIQVDGTIGEVWPQVDALIDWWALARANGPPWRLPDRLEIACNAAVAAGREVVPLFADRDSHATTATRPPGAVAEGREPRLSSGVGK